MRDPDKRKAQARSWALHHPKRRKEIRIASDRRNPERMRKKFEALRQQFPIGSERERVRRAVCAQRHRQRYPHSRSNLSRLEWAKIASTSEFRCVYCGNESQHLELDHFDPVSRTEPTHPPLLIPSCRSCNRNKSDKEPVEWIEETFGVDGLSRVLFYIENRYIHPALYD